MTLSKTVGVSINEAFVQPWEIARSKLRPDLLALVRDIVWQCQLDVASGWLPDDNMWIAGCRAYWWRVQRITRAATAEYASWLSVEWIDNQFYFKINGIPVRVYRPAEKPEDNDPLVPPRYADAPAEERRTLSAQLALGDAPAVDVDWVFRLEIVTDDKANKARPLSVHLARVTQDGKRLEDPYEIPAAVSVVIDNDSVTQPDAHKRVHGRKEAVTLADAKRERAAKQRDTAAATELDAGGSAL